MLKFSRDSEIDFNLYEHRLRYEPHIFLNVTKMRSQMLYDIMHEESLKGLSERIMKVNSSGMCTNIGNDQDKYTFLTDYQYCPNHYFTRTKNKRGFSIAKDILENLHKKGYSQEFLEVYLAYRTIEKKTDKISKIIQTAKMFQDRDNYGNEIRRMPYQVEQQQNFRYNYNSYDIVTIPKDYSKCVTSPSGRMLVWGDFAQADFRVAYNLLIRDEVNQKIMDKYEDKYEGLARIIANANNEKFDHDKFTKERNAYKTCTLGTIYGKNSSEDEGERAFIQKFSAFLSTCPQYVEFKQRIKDRLKLNKPVVIDTYFGLPIAVPYQSGFDKDPMNKALNTPIQAGTSQLIVLTVNAILDKFYALGYTEEDIHVYYVRHDEPIFIMDTKVMKDSWIFKDCSDILVDDWTPLKADFYFGYDYTRVDEQLMKDYKELCSINKHRMKTEVPDDSMPTFLPIKRTLRLAIGIAETTDRETIVSIYDKVNSRVSYLKIPTTYEAEVYEEVEKRLCSIDEKLYSKEFTGAFVKTRGFDKEAFYNKLFFKYKTKLDDDIKLAECLAEHMAYSYDKKKGYDVSPSDVCLANYEIMKSIKMVDLFND